MGKIKKKGKITRLQKTSQNKQSKTEKTERDFSTTELEEAIVKALQRYEKERIVQSVDEKENSTNGLKGWFYNIRLILRMPFERKDSIKGNEAVTVMTSSLLAAVFSMLRIIGLALSFLSLGTIIYLVATEELGSMFFGKIFFLLLVAFISYLFAGLFRRVSVEVEKIKDESLLIAFFAAIGTWISIIIAAVALWR